MSKKSKKRKKIKRGSVVVFDPSNFNPKFWDDLSEEDRIKYYGPLGYGQKQKLFVFLCEILTADGYPSGHCVLLELNHQQPLNIEYMRHTSDFRLATEDEF
jgi:hypothetical protein